MRCCLTFVKRTAIACHQTILRIWPIFGLHATAVRFANVRQSRDSGNATLFGGLRLSVQLGEKAEEEGEGKTLETESGEEKTKQRAVFLPYHTVFELVVSYRFGWISSRTSNRKLEAVQDIQEMHLMTSGTYRSARIN